MDVCESRKASPRRSKAVEISRQPLVLAEKNNAATTTRRSQTREVSSRYKSPTPPSTPSGSRRCPSPNLTRTATPASSQLLQKRSLSAERKRPSTPPSPPSRRPSTPVNDSSVDGKLASRRVAGSRLPEGLWPSTMRSLSVSFQSDSISIPVSKKERPVTSASDRSLRPASNVAHRQGETPTTIRKATPERKRSPLIGKNASDQSENSKPVDSLPSRLVDQHRWPSRIGGRVSSSALNRSVDCGDARMLKTPAPGAGFSSLRRLSFPEEASQPLQRASSDSVRLLSLVASGRTGSGVKSVDDCSLHDLRPHKSSATPSDRAGLSIAGFRSQSLSAPGSRLPSPIRTSVQSTSSLRGVSPSRSRPSTPPSRGVSPSRIRPTSSSIQPNNSVSVLSFIADFRKGQKGAAFIEDAHQLRLLYNRFMQWRFANARAEAVLYIQNAIVQKTLYNVWITTMSLWESVTRKKIDLQQLKLELKLNSVLNDQMTYLDEWAVLETDHVDALSGAVEDLEASTLRLPVTGGAMVDLEQLKVAICQAVDVMQAMGSAIRSLFSQVEGMNALISEVAVVATQEKSMLDECEMLLASVAALQVEESSLQTHLIQIKQALGVVK